MLNGAQKDSINRDQQGLRMEENQEIADKCLENQTTCIAGPAASEIARNCYQHVFMNLFLITVTLFVSIRLRVKLCKMLRLLPS